MGCRAPRQRKELDSFIQSLVSPFPGQQREKTCPLCSFHPEFVKRQLCQALCGLRTDNESSSTWRIYKAVERGKRLLRN
ncbi:hypothetical protein GW7_15862 [Heterocephalus glaber]|uniref:Uncharacterized protein n=1 Tax=Heterocephalus glaber TaxID=10181 RepID=G5C2D4_HETGA|nr:hypothetical protein GW7_15862 [Heterocephalus glaber]